MHQQAYTRVDEEGAEADIAVGSVANTRGFRAGTKEFLCDNHPFLFMIVENTFGNVLFEGSVANPSIRIGDELTTTTTVTTTATTTTPTTASTTITTPTTPVTRGND